MIWCGRTNYKYPEMPVTDDISQVTCRTCLMAYNRSKERRKGEQMSKSIFKKPVEKIHFAVGKPAPNSGLTTDSNWMWETLCGKQSVNSMAKRPIGWKDVTCHHCIQIAYRRKLSELVEIATQANLISCNLTTFHTLRDMDKLSTLMHRNNNLFIHNNEEKQDE